MSTWEIKFYELCAEVDEWKAEAEHWEKEYKKLRKEYSVHMDEQIKHGNAMMGNFLKLALETDAQQLVNAFGENKETE